MKGALKYFSGVSRAAEYRRTPGRWRDLLSALWVGMFVLSAWGAEGTRFLVLDVFVDSKRAALSAYQLEVGLGKESKVVGVEGGEHAEFAKAPFYDPKAMQRERIVVAAFSVAEEGKLPRGRTRVLTLHVQTGAAPLAPDVRKFLATDSNGKKIDATIRVVERRE